jgi:hypothetical protein
MLLDDLLSDKPALRRLIGRLRRYSRRPSTHRSMRVSSIRRRSMRSYSHASWELELNPQCFRRTANMFEIEFVAVRGSTQAEVVEKMTTAAARLVDADKTAKLLLEKVRQKRRTMPPDGYQIRTDDGRVVLRFLER